MTNKQMKKLKIKQLTSQSFFIKEERYSEEHSLNKKQSGRWFLILIYLLALVAFILIILSLAGVINSSYDLQFVLSFLLCTFIYLGYIVGSNMTDNSLQSYVFVLDPIKKDFRIEGIGRALEYDNFTHKATLKEIANEGNDILRLSLNQVERFEMRKKDGSPTLTQQFKLQYGSNFTENIRRYHWEICLITRGHTESTIVLFKSAEFSAQYPLPTKDTERLEQVTKVLNDFIRCPPPEHTDFDLS